MDPTARRSGSGDPYLVSGHHPSIASRPQPRRDANLKSPEASWSRRGSHSTRDMTEAPVTSSLGPLGPLLGRLHSLLDADIHLPHSVNKADLRQFTSDLEEVGTSIMEISKAEDPNLADKCWMKDVRELSFDTEDFLDTVVPSGSQVPRKTRIRTKMKRRKRHLQIAKDISELRARLQEATERHERYQPGVVQTFTPTKKKLIGLDKPMKDLVALLKFDRTEKLMVVSITGFAGVGKTTLATRLYHLYRGRFQCKAYLRVSRNPDTRRLLASLISQLTRSESPATPDVHDLITNIRDHLQGKSYFIIVDDLWAPSVWDTIRRAFPDDNCCSRIVTTTQIDDVALGCCRYDSEHIFKLGPLNDYDSRNLFLSTVGASENDSFDQQFLDSIVSKCDGLPLAITSVAGMLLPSWPNVAMERLTYIQDSLCCNLGSSPKSGEMKKVMNLVYNDLPAQLKTCLLYLNIYPEDSVILKDDLVKQWLAEGFLSAVKQQDMEIVARSYFDELVTRGMIQPIDTNCNDEVLSFTVHHGVLDLIAHECMDENFITVVDCSETSGVPDKIRRLSVKFGGAKNTYIPSRMRVSQVRTLAFSGFFKCVPSIVQYQLLRVLILRIWTDEDKKTLDLSSISEMSQMRYLKIECSMTVKFPAEIRGLQHLGTLVVNARVASVPTDIVHLQRLLHLHLPPETSLPLRIGYMTSLRSLGNFNLSSNSKHIIMGLGKLTGLRDLRMTYSVERPDRVVSNMKHLAAIVGKMDNLKSLILEGYSSKKQNHINTWAENHHGGAFSISDISRDSLTTVYPRLALLERLELSPRICTFLDIPEWVNEFSKLSILKIALQSLSSKDVDVFRRMPALASLSLYVQTAPYECIIIQNEGFSVLKHFKFVCSALCLAFVQGAMPSVQQLKLRLSSQQFVQDSLLYSGIEHLASLLVISAKIGGANAYESQRNMRSALEVVFNKRKIHPIINVKVVDKSFYVEEDDPTMDTGEQAASKIDGPPQSSIDATTHSGTTEKDMEATAVSLARSVLDGVLSGAGATVTNEVARLLGVPKEVESIRSELEMAQDFLKLALAHPEATVRRDTLQAWVKQVRDLAYDVEYCLDFALYAARTSSSLAGSCLPHAIAERHRITARIRDLKASIKELNQRSQRYRIVVGSPAVRFVEEQSTLLDHDMHSAELAFQASDIIGRGSEKADLTQLISVRNGPVTVVSVWGMGGMGKSSLVWKVHNDPVLLDEFDCGAWVTVPHRLDNPEVFRWRLRKELGLARDQNVGEHLQEKRYRVVVDDVESSEEWDNICQVFQFQNNKGSCIIVTTRTQEVAKYCTRHVAEWRGHVYELKPLGDAESMDLFCKKVYKTTNYVFPRDMEDQANHILRRCHGIPLSISTIGGLLANRPKTSIEWSNLHQLLGAKLESDLRNITKVIVSVSYDGLPYQLKSIFLYLGIFPENHEIRRTRLKRRWMAEGYISKNHDMPVEDVGERFYSELINRSMIQPSKANPGFKADRCRVHSTVLQIILSKSIEENQLFLIEKQPNEVPQSKVHHLVVSRWQRRDERLQNIDPSYLRSLTVFGKCPASLISPKMPLLRVVDLEDTSNLRNDDLKHIGELQHLRYLCLRGTDISKLPSSLQNLRCLETLDIQDTQVWELPGGVAKLEKLRYLLCGVSFTKDLLQKMGESGKANNETSLFGYIESCLFCSSSSECCKVSSVDQFSLRAPEGIENLKNLHMLGVVNVGKGSGAVGRLKNLTNLTNLQRLGVTGLSEKQGQELCKSLGELRRLQRLDVRSDSLKFLAEPARVPTHLVSLRLCGVLSSMPRWISSLKYLAKLKLMGTRLKQEDIQHLQNLHNLSLLGLWENSYMDKSLHFYTGTSPKLKFLDIDRLKEIETVTVVKGAMPELEQLWVHNCPSLRDDSSGLSGVPHLPRLNELLLKNCGEKENLINKLQEQVNGHIRRPKFLIGKSIVLASLMQRTMITLVE